MTESTVGPPTVMRYLTSKFFTGLLRDDLIRSIGVSFVEVEGLTNGLVSEEMAFSLVRHFSEMTERPTPNGLGPLQMASNDMRHFSEVSEEPGSFESFSGRISVVVHNQLTIRMSIQNVIDDVLNSLPPSAFQSPPPRRPRRRSTREYFIGLGSFEEESLGFFAARHYAVASEALSYFSPSVRQAPAA